ncbi:MAG: LysM peptidoglycan-binding domain-containing protein [Chloroflexota bacterium]
MRQDERRQAEALDSFLSGRLAGGQSRPASELDPAEAALAADLVNLAGAVELDPASSETLKWRLKQAPRPASSLFFPRRSWPVPRRALVGLVGAAALVLLILLAQTLLGSRPSLPPLPSLGVLNAQAQDRVQVVSPAPAEFVLNASLPAAPEHLTVYRQATGSPRLADARQLADTLGLHGEFYVQQASPAEVEAGEPVASLPVYVLFDGARQLAVSAGGVYYRDVLGPLAFDPVISPTLSVAAAAEDFLDRHPLLDVPYRLEPEINGNVLRFTPLIDDRPVLYAGMEVAFEYEGRVAQLTSYPLHLEPVGRYPVISAQEAVQLLLSNQPDHQIYTLRFSDPEPPPGPFNTPMLPAPTGGSFRLLIPEYQAGQEIHVYGLPRVFQPVEGGEPPRVEVNTWRLQGPAAELQAIAGKPAQPLHVWGRVQGGQSEQIIRLSGWEKASPARFFRGRLLFREGLLLLRTDSRQTFVLAQPLVGLHNGQAVELYGHETDRGEGNYPLLDWTALQLPIVVTATVEEEPPAALTPEPGSVSHPPPAPTVSYIIEEGDTLLSIARQFEVTAEAIRQANDLADTRTLQVGRKLVIPLPVESQDSIPIPNRTPERWAGQHTIEYTVQPGETLSGIARRYGVPLESIFQAKTLTPATEPQAGETLLIPITATSLAISSDSSDPAFASQPPFEPGQPVIDLVGRLRAITFDSPVGPLVQARLDFFGGWWQQTPWSVWLAGPGLAGIEQYNHLHVRLSGRYVIKENRPTLEVKEYEPVYPGERLQTWVGRVMEKFVMHGQEVALFETEAGERYALLDPSQWPEVERGRVMLVGVVEPQPFGPFPAIHIINVLAGEAVQQVTDLKDQAPAPDPASASPSSRPGLDRLLIEQIELVYYAVRPGDVFHPLDLPKDSDLRLVQPVWRFAGHSQDGTAFEVLIQAVADEYVEYSLPEKFSPGLGDGGMKNKGKNPLIP